MTSLRYALRSLRRSPGFVAISVLALGLGLGMSTTMFAVMDAVLNPHVAYERPEQLFSINWWFGRRQPLNNQQLYELFRDRTTSFQAVVPRQSGGVGPLSIGTELVEINAAQVGWRYFDVLGVRPMLGRRFQSSDGADVAVISEDLWTRHFGGRRSLDGATITAGTNQLSIIGVTPRNAGTNRLWSPLPLGMAAQVRPGWAGRPLVRLREGVTREQAAEELKTLARALTDMHRAHDAPFAFDLSPLVQPSESIRDIHKAMVGSALAVLLIACVNLAHLMMARGMAKRRELALRLAIGATRGVVVRQLFLECALITVAGALLGALVTIWGADVLRNRIPREVSWIGFVQPQLSWRVFAASALAAAVSAVLFGLLPALKVVLGVSLDDPLKDDTGTTTGRVRYRYNPLVAAEVGLALVLMMGGALLLRTVYSLSREAPGYDTSTLFHGFVAAHNGRLPADTTRRRVMMSRSAVLAAAEAIPGVRGVAMEGGRGARGGGVTAEMSGDSNRILTMQYIPAVTSTYFQVLGLPILEGRDFTAGDATGNGVAIIDPLAAQRLYPGQKALGRMIKLGGPMTDAPWVPIVGIVRSPWVMSPMERFENRPSVFVSLRGSDSTEFGSMIVRTVNNDSRTVATLQARMRELPGVSTASLYPFDWQRQSELKSRGFLAKVFVGMGAVALALAGLGLYGVLAYTVGRRMREFAVRLALGCEPHKLRRMVLHDGFVMLLAGIGVGAFFALAASRWLDSVLISVLPSDVISLIAAEALLFTVGFLAALAPARRAERADPLEILRAS